MRAARVAPEPCGVTKGALYHHFAGKREIFEAVFRAEEERICGALAAAAARRRDPEPLAHLVFGALCEGAMFVARADDQAAAKRRFEREMKAMIDAYTD